MLLERLYPGSPHGGSNSLSQILDLHWRSPESGVLWYESGHLKKTICSSWMTLPATEGDPNHTVENDPFIGSQLALRNLLKGLV